MKFPTIFVNHGGGPLPLMGSQPGVVRHLESVVQQHLLPLGQPPKAIVVVSAHWEANPIRIQSAKAPSMYYDYGGFPPETYKYKYDAPGHAELAQRIQRLLKDEVDLDSKLDTKRGFDHGVFVPLKIMYPKADIPVVAVSLHSSLDAATHLKVGRALRALRQEEDNVLILGSGYTFHNMHSIFHPSDESLQSSVKFNGWLKKTLMESETVEQRNVALEQWSQQAPEARACHPREEHLLPLFVCATAATGGSTKTQVIMDEVDGSHAVTAYLFQDE